MRDLYQISPKQCVTIRVVAEEAIDLVASKAASLRSVSSP